MRVAVVNDIFVRRCGREGAPKLFCLHGFADSGHMFVPLADTSLAERFELVAVDSPGFGVSPRAASINLIEDHARAVAALAAEIAPGEPVGLVGHSIASAIAVATVSALDTAPLGVFSIEGNLTAADAYFSGQAADWDAAAPFKEAFAAEIWRAGESNADLRRYFGGVVMADANAMWQLGKDARKVSEGDAVGLAFKALAVPALYYWSAETTPEVTQKFIEMHGLRNKQYQVASHWPTVTSPGDTGAAIGAFFGGLV